MDAKDFTRAYRFAENNGLVLQEQLGFGIHGRVWAAQRTADQANVAVKVFEEELFYERKKNVYLRLRKHEITIICGCSVPQCLSYNDDLWAIGMTIVERPFVLDFAGARLDERVDFPEEVISEWLTEKEDQFGEDWARAWEVVMALEKFGIYLTDVSPSNIALPQDV